LPQADKVVVAKALSAKERLVIRVMIASCLKNSGFIPVIRPL
jgi:hypothetical protein